MKTVLVYYPFALAKDANSGSKLRPLEMKKAFEAWGKLNDVKVILISGTTAERRQQFQEHLASGALDNLWFCYMENQTIPLWLTDPGHKPKHPFIDRQILKFLKSKNVPTGVFYRDVYWKFDHIYPLKGYKKTIMQSIYKIEEKFYEKYCDVIFLPSLEMGKYVDIDRPMVDLPPGGKKVELSQKESHGEPFHAIYVGAIKGADYGFDLLLGAFDIINREQQRCDLTIVCRQPEYESLTAQQKEQLTKLGIKVMHISGEKLDELYKEVDFALIPRKCTEYQNFSMPVKLVEYLSNNLPIVATACDAQKRFLGENGYGIICGDEEKSMAAAIEEMMGSLEQYQENIQQTFMKNHSWLARVEKVKSSLVGSE
ncbi:glycosyltransferase [Mesobacillus subterraneus]|uniref:glycosyltransferase n=1 Tax=Mesobacillus subterraneus TaxID=285983 RepID=UPI00203E50BF|nr:glycosyltransferase [Mesobacillus subterraneus]MCM3663611.1 glycosyltransferase [Mesobacillus subterraneus]MCM3683377.1 glycosyltransferase [Mesobacillus subterraneus]